MKKFLWWFNCTS